MGKKTSGPAAGSKKQNASELAEAVPAVVDDPNACGTFYLSLALSVVVAAFATWFAARRYESIHHLAQLSVREQEMTLTTESAFYYSFYRDVVDAPSLQSAYQHLSQNTDTEHPDTIDILHRFNVVQEVARRWWRCLTGCSRCCWACSID